MSTPTTNTDNQETAVPMVKALIDGIEVEVPKGTLMIRAAEEIGIQIPRFCDHPLLEPVGACRQCLVDVAAPDRSGEVRSFPKPMPACTSEVTEGMEVKTQHTSEKADKAQQGVMEFLLINHPLDCPVCDKGGECPLQNQAMSNGSATSRFKDVKRTFPKPLKISTQVLLDRERCVLCQRCTRFSKQIAGDVFIDLQMRGASQQIGTFDAATLGFEGTDGDAMSAEDGVPFASYFSGNTIQICPVGALTSAAYRFRSRPFDLVSTDSVCEHCASGCSLRIDHRRGTVLRRLAGTDMDVNEEWNCDKGRFAFPWQSMGDRLERPLVRDAETGELREASWPDALSVAAAGLAAARDGDFSAASANGDDEVGAGVGVLLGGHLTYEDAYSYAKFARLGLGTNDIDARIRSISGEEHDFLAARVAGQPLGSSATFADIEAADTVLLVGLETEEEAPSVFLRLRKAVRAKNTKVISVAPFSTRGAQKLSATVIQAAPGTEPEIVDGLRTAHEEVADSAEALRTGKAVVLIGERAGQVDGLLSACVALVDELGATMGWVPRRAGERGAIDAGALPGLLPGGRSVEIASARAEVASAWGVGELPASAGLDAERLIAACAAGERSGLLIAGVDYRDAHDPAAVLSAVENTPFVVVADVRRTALAEMADVVFPVAPPAERYGSFVNFEGRLRPFEKALDTTAMTDTRLVATLAEYMDVEELAGLDLDSARRELDVLGGWNGERQVAPRVSVSPPAPPASGTAVVASWHQLLDAGVMQDGEPHLAGTARRAVVRMSAATARMAGVSSGQRAELGGTSGKASLPVLVTDMPDGVVWVPATIGSRTGRELGIIPGGVVHVSAAADATSEGVSA